MKKINDIYIPSITEIKAAAAHLRKLESAATNSEGIKSSYFDCVYLPEQGSFQFNEFCDPHSYVDYGDTQHVYIPSECGKEWADSSSSPEAIRKEIEKLAS